MPQSTGPWYLSIVGIWRGCSCSSCVVRSRCAPSAASEPEVLPNDSARQMQARRGARSTCTRHPHAAALRVGAQAREHDAKQRALRCETASHVSPYLLSPSACSNNFSMAALSLNRGDGFFFCEKCLPRTKPVLKGEVKKPKVEQEAGAASIHLLGSPVNAGVSACSVAPLW